MNENSNSNNNNKTQESQANKTRCDANGTLSDTYTKTNAIFCCCYDDDNAPSKENRFFYTSKHFCTHILQMLWRKHILTKNMALDNTYNRYSACASAKKLYQIPKICVLFFFLDFCLNNLGFNSIPKLSFFANSCFYSFLYFIFSNRLNVCARTNKQILFIFSFIFLLFAEICRTTMVFEDEYYLLYFVSIQAAHSTQKTKLNRPEFTSMEFLFSPMYNS